MVAVKRFSELDAISFEKELHNLVTGKHKGVVSIFGVSVETECCILLEHMPHGSLQDYIDKKSFLFNLNLFYKIKKLEKDVLNLTKNNYCL